jgi:hypothetical protein
VIADKLAPLGEDATPKERALRAIHDGRDALRHYALSPGSWRRSASRSRRRARARIPRRCSPAWIWYGSFLMYHGRTDEAVAELEGCQRSSKARPGTFNASDRREVLKRLGWRGSAWASAAIAWRATPASRASSRCRALPLHVETQGAERARKVMQRPARARSAGPPARWLLNLAHQALGTPEEVPEALRFPRARLASEAPFRHFTDVARKLHLAPLGRAGSVIADEFHRRRPARSR